MSIGKRLATFNLFREADNSLHVTIADARGVRDELGDSNAPLHLCAMNALRAAEEIREPATELIEALGGMIRYAESVRVMAGMGKTQQQHFDRAKAILARARGETA